MVYKAWKEHRNQPVAVYYHKMKVALLLLAVIGLANSSVILPGRGRSHDVVLKNVNLRDLNDLLQQFANFIPFDKCLIIVNRYLENDPDVQKGWAFLKSDTFAALTDKVEKMQEYQDFLKYLYDSGLDIYTYENIIRRMLGLPPIEHLASHRWVRESGIIKMINEILSVLPVQEIKDWFQNVCLPDPAFQKLIQRILSPDFQKLVDSVVNSPEYKQLTDVLREQGIDVDAIQKAIEDFFNKRTRKFGLRSLKSLLEEFEALIPVNDIIGIVIPYVLNDPDVKKVLLFLQGEDFRNLMIKMTAVQELKDFFAWVYAHGIDIYSAINNIFDFLGIPHINPKTVPKFRFPSAQSGLTNMIDDIIKILPLDKIVEWYHSSCENDPDFISLIAQLRSDSFLVVVKTFREDPLFPVMRQGLVDLDINMDVVEQFLHSTFGW